MNLKYTLTADDYLAFNMHYLRTSELGQRQLRSYRLAIAVAAPLIGAVIVGLLSGRFLGGVAFALPVAAVAWLLAPKLWYRAARKQLGEIAQSPGLGTLGTHTLVLQEDGLCEEADGVVLHASWSAIERVDESAGYAYIFFGLARAYIVPKRLISCQVEQFLAEVRRHCNMESAVQ
jgi:YcxB-like protein